MAIITSGDDDDRSDHRYFKAGAVNLRSRWEELEAAEGLLRKGRRAVPLRIRFYLDSYRAQLVAKQVASQSIEYLDSVLAGASSGDAAALRRRLNFELTPGKLAELISTSLMSVESAVVRGYEDRLRSSGADVASSKDLLSAAFALSNSYAVPKLFDKSPIEVTGDTYVEISSDGLVFAPTPVDREFELARLRRLSRSARGDDRDWHIANQRALTEGKLIRRNGEVVDVAFSETFVDEVASRLGAASREGHYRIWWSESLTLKEKGVDADLIIKVMDDLRSEDVDVFAFFTNDSDFAPLIRRVKTAGKDVILCGTGQGVSRDLIRAVGSESTFFDLTGPEMGPPLDIWLPSQDWEAFELLHHVTSQHDWYAWADENKQE